MKKSTLINCIANNGPLLRLMLCSTLIESTDQKKVVNIIPDDTLTQDQRDDMPFFCEFNGDKIQIKGLNLADLYSTINGAGCLLKKFINEKQEAICDVLSQLEKRKILANIDVPDFKVNTSCYDAARHVQVVFTYLQNQNTNYKQHKAA